MSAIRERVATARQMLSKIITLNQLSGNAMVLLPGNSSQGSTSGERTIGLNVAALNFSQGKDITEVLLEWIKWVWEEHLVEELGEYRRPPLRSASSTVPLYVFFLQHHVEKILTDENVADDFMREIQEIISRGLAVTGMLQPKKTRIKCPGDWREMLCNAYLQFDDAGNDAPVTCRKCGTVWSKERLITVSLSIPSR